MPLSRLSPRSHQKGVSTRGKKSSRPDGKSRDVRSRHLRLWEAIRLTREELENWKSLSEQIEKLFRDLILPREERITRTLGRLTGDLITHFNNPDRDTAERSLLGLWIIENFNTLNEHPFATRSGYKDQFTRFSAILDNNDPIDSQLIRLLQRSGARDNNQSEASEQDHTFRSKPASPQQTNIEPEESEDIVFDFGWHKKPPTSENKQEENSGRSEKPGANQTQNEEPDHDEDFIDSAELDEKIKKSEKSLSVNRLFRQLAKVLHPDREQDETLKAEKHLLMSQCLEARQNKDIDTLLKLYCEHVGDLPDELSDTSHKELISALELQLKLLQRELRQERFGDALLTQIVERYSDSNHQQIEAKVALHAKQLDQELNRNNSEIERLNTPAGLKLALNQRRSIELDRMTINEITGAD